MEEFTQPDLFGSAIYSNSTFDVFVGLGNDKTIMPHYLCLNKQTGVAEFEAENFFMARSWADHYEKEMKGFEKPVKVQEELSLEDPMVLPFKKPDKLN